jgi:DHA2 family multidrug resistance protein
MSAEARVAEWTPARSAAGLYNPWLITLVLSLATFMEVLDTSVANIALGHIGGALGASYDEATWVLTSYLVANAVIVPLSGWLSAALGRKRYYLISVALFTVTSVACAFAPSIGWLVFLRVLQGIGGGGLAPCEQSMLIDTFPPERRGQAISAYGLVLIVGPALGPTIGGAITEVASWRWLFLINLPVGLLSLALVSWLVSEPAILREERATQRKLGLRLDLAGFALVALGLGALQFVIDRGQISDWFASPAIRLFSLCAVLSLAALCVWEWRCRNPVLNLHLFKEPNFAAAGALMLVTGAVLYATTQIVPQYLQQVMGYTAAWAGLAMTASSAATVVSTVAAGLLSRRVTAWKMITAGLLIEIAGLAHATNISGHMSFWFMAVDRIWIVIGLPFILVPLTTGAYARLSARHTGQASAFLNLFRNLGGGVGIAAAQTILARRQPWHEAHLAERVSDLDWRWRWARTLAPSRLSPMFQHGQQSLQRGAGLLIASLRREALVLAYIDVFWVFAALAAASLVLVPLLAIGARRPNPGPVSPPEALPHAL